MKKAVVLFILFSCLVRGIVGAQNISVLHDYESHLNSLDRWERAFEYDSLELVNRSLERLIVSHPELLTINVQSLSNRGNKILTSEDRKVRTYSWDDRMGGTMRSANTVVHYVTGTQVKADVLCNRTLEDPICPFHYELHSLATASDTFYLIMNHWIGSSGMGNFEIEAFKISGDTLQWDIPFFETKNGVVSSINYEYDVTSGGPNPTAGHPIIKIDWPEKIIRIPLIDSKNRITEKYLVYTFNGQRFKFQRVE